MIKTCKIEVFEGSRGGGGRARYLLEFEDGLLRHHSVK